MERFLNTLGTIAAAGPLLGLLGTVVGMIQMFLGILDHGVGDVNQLAGGIGKALVCTAAGMIVAIPALMFHRYFRGRIAGYVIDMEHEAIALLDALDAAPRPRAAARRTAAPRRRAGLRRRMRIRDDRADDEPEINLVPLIDVILVLIIFFVVTTTFDARSMLQAAAAAGHRRAGRRAGQGAERAGQCRGPLFRRRPRSAAHRRRLAEADAARGRPATTATARCCCAPMRAPRTRRWSPRWTRWASSASAGDRSPPRRAAAAAQAERTP